MKSADERIDHLERTVRMYRALAVLTFLLLLVMQRQKIVGWIDHMESWFSAVSTVHSG